MDLCDKIKSQVSSEKERTSGLLNSNKIKLESSLIKLDGSNITKMYSPRLNSGVPREERNSRGGDSRGFSPPRSKLNDV